MILLLKASISQLSLDNTLGANYVPDLRLEDSVCPQDRSAAIVRKQIDCVLMLKPSNTAQGNLILKSMRSWAQHLDLSLNPTNTYQFNIFYGIVTIDLEQPLGDEERVRCAV